MFNMSIIIESIKLGTGRTDFYHQLEGDNVLDFDLVTIIAVELPGWGRSRPPVRKYGTGVYENDAQCLYELMKVRLFVRSEVF